MGSLVSDRISRSSELERKKNLSEELQLVDGSLVVEYGEVVIPWKALSLPFQIIIQALANQIQELVGLLELFQDPVDLNH